MSDWITMEGITKSFGSVLANAGVDLAIARGEVHAIIGENGAGKSTLMKLLYGMEQPDAGTIRIDGRSIHLSGPRDAIALGIGMVHQHFMLANSLTVLENLILGNRSYRWLDRRKAAAEIATVARRFGLQLNLTARVRDLSVGEMQRAEILKALYWGADLLILDEPTAVLTPPEAKELFVMLRDLAAHGKSVIFISHKLREVLAVADRVSVMRAGRHVATVVAASATEADLAHMMVGRDVLLRQSRRRQSDGAPTVRVEGLSILDNRGLPAVKGVSLMIRSGEILGVAGVEGNGQSELVEAIAGLRPVTSGRVTVQGKELTGQTVSQRRRAGVAHIPEDRLRRGVAAMATIAENLIMGIQYRPALSRRGVLRLGAIGRHALDMIERFGIRTAGPTQEAGALSGGNIQKVVVARELGDNPVLLLASQPTRGVDIGAIEYIHGQLLDLRDRGCATLLVSADLDEVLALSDRVVVMYEGEIVGEMTGEQIDEEQIGLLMGGASAATPREVMS